MNQRGGCKRNLRRSRGRRVVCGSLREEKSAKSSIRSSDRMTLALKTTQTSSHTTLEACKHLQRISTLSPEPSSSLSASTRDRQFVGTITRNKSNSISKRNSSKLAFLALVTFTTILNLTCLMNQQVSSLNCYTCSSADDPGCDEAFTGRANITNTDCVAHIGKQAKVCRKIVQYLENKKVVIRSCGWIDEHEDKKPMCYKRSGTFALMMESCICYEDNCNHSASLVPNQSVLILLACGSITFFYLMGSANGYGGGGQLRNRLAMGAH